MYRIIPVLIFMTLLFSCDEDNLNSITPTSEDFIRATVDGKPYESNLGAAAWIVADGTNSDSTILFTMGGIDAVTNSNYLSILLYGTVEPEEQSYSSTYEECSIETTPLCIILSYYNDAENESDEFNYSNDFPGMDATIEFHSIKFEPGGSVEATFSGTIRDEYSNDVIEVENGELRIAIEE